jgi:hypothetical protein
VGAATAALEPVAAEAAIISMKTPSTVSARLIPEVAMLLIYLWEELCVESLQDA